MRENRKTDYRFKLLYAFAIIMVVLDHADGGGIALKTDWYLYGGLPLPLFIFCSGYFYRDADEENAGMYIRRKAMTLLIPLYLYTIAYGLIVQLLRAKGFAMGGDLTPENILIAPLINGHQFVYNMGGWFIAPLFMVEIYNLLVRKLLKLINPQISETVFFVIGILSGLAGNQLACMGFLAGWRLALVRMLYFVPFYSLGIFYRRILEKTDRKIPSFRLFTVIFAIKFLIVWYYGRPLRYTFAWCNDFTEGPVMPIVIGFLGIAMWMRIAVILTPVIGRSRWINLVADSTYSIMMNQFLGFMLVKTVFALGSRVYAGFADFDWIRYKTDIWYYYMPKGVVYTLTVYSFAGVAFPILVQMLLNKGKQALRRGEDGKNGKRAGITTGLKRKNGMLAGLLIMALLCCGCGAGTAQTAVPGTASPTPSEEDKKDMVYLRIQTVPEMSAEGLAAARPVLIRRLDLYAGNGPWILECFEDPEGERPCGPEDDFVRADVWYPAELFEDKDILSQARAMIIRPMKLFLVQYTNGRMRGGFLELPREAIASLEGGSGNCDALDAADYEMTEDEFFWIRMRLAESFVKEHTEEFERVKGQLAVIQDADMQNMYFGFRMVPGETLDDWYIVLDSTTEKRFQDLVLYNYSQPPLETGFMLYDRREPVNWMEPAKAEDAGTAETPSGSAPESCLVSRSDLTGDRLRLTFQPKEEVYDDRTWPEVISAMRTRMDLIGEPYCMGISDLCDQRIVIETENVTRMGYPVIQLLADGQSLHLACTTMSLVDLMQPEKDRIEVLTEGDRILGLAVDVSERHTIGLYKEMQDGLRLGAGEIVLLDDVYHYFRAPMNVPDGDGKLLMTSKISGIGEREAEDGWFYRLARQVILDEITEDFDQTAGYYSAEGEPLEMPEFPIRK